MVWLLLLILPLNAAADIIFVYSSVNRMYGVNLTTQQETYLTTASLSASVNALAINSGTGVIYYGDDTSIYYWDPSLGTGPNSHALINNFENGFFQAPIHNLNSTGGTYLDGKYYIGSEDDSGFIEELYALVMSADGRQIVSMQALNIQAACNCSGVQLGGFGDIAVINGPNGPEIYGSSADLTRNGQGTHAGIWRLELNTNTWTLLADGVGGQMAESLGGQVFSNVGNNISELNKSTGNVSSQTLLTTSQAIWDFSGGFSYDFGDAPDSYGAAMHLVGAVQSTPVILGQTAPDSEPYTQHGGAGGSDGLGDDNNGVADEDGLAVLPVLEVGQSEMEFSVNCSAGHVVAWIDFNLNGKFDFAERNSNHPVSCNAANTTLSWSGFATPAKGTSYIRIRAASSANDIYKPTGYANGGEVEDYEIEILDNTASSGSCPVGSESHRYISTDIPKSYSGSQNNPIISTIAIADSMVVTDLNVLNVNASHQNQRRLKFYLRKGSDVAQLYGDTCNRNRSFNISFDDEAASDVQCYPSSGQLYLPDQALSVFDGSDAQGTWELLIENGRWRNSGVLNAWELEVCSAGVVDEKPEIRLGKSVDVVDRIVTITLLIKNVGNAVLDNIRLTDNLDAVFGAANYTINSAPEILASPAGFSANAAYNGVPGTIELLSGSASLQPGDEIKLKFSVDVGYAFAADDTYQNQALVKATSAVGNEIDDLSSSGLDLSTDKDNPTPISLSGTIQIGGVVFLDTSANAQTSHDGIQQSTEFGLVGRAVTIRDIASGDELAASVTVADGSWAAQIDASYLSQFLEVIVVSNSSTQFISETPANTDASNADGRVRFVVQQNASANNSSVGLVDRPTLNLDQTANIVAGQSTQYNHIYTASTHGSVDFTITTSSSSPNLSWVETVHHDLNCNEQIDGSDYLINSSVSVTYEEVVCLVVDVASKSTGSSDGTHTLELAANLQPIDFANTAHGVSFVNINKDITHLIAAGVGNLVLKKSVRNISLGGQPVSQNSALPGHILEYTISYTNTGAGRINDLEITDEAPAYTHVVPASAGCGQTPTSLQCTPGEVNAQVNWLFQGFLAPGTNGEVHYRIKVD